MSSTDTQQAEARQTPAPAATAEAQKSDKLGDGKSPKSKKAKAAEKKAGAKKNDKKKASSKKNNSKTSSSKSSSSGGGSDRLSPGALDGIVLAYMRDHPDELPISPSRVAKGTGRSSGAIGNCLERLKNQKKVRRVEDKPRKYDLPEEK